MTVWRALLAAAISGLFCAGAARADCRLGVADLPVTMHGMQPIVSAKLDGRPVNFLLDTGAFYSLISPPLAHELKLNLEMLPMGTTIEGVGGSTEGWSTTVREVQIADVPLYDLEFVVAGSGVGDAGGVIGQNILGLSDLDIDLGGGRVRMVWPKGCPMDRPPQNWARNTSYATLPIDSSDPRHNFIRGVVLVNGRRVKALFDTGASTSVNSRSAAARAGVDVGSPDVERAGFQRGLGQSAVPIWIGPFANVQIGEEQVKNTRLRIGDFGDREDEMLIGADFFLSHKVYVAHSQSKLYLSYVGGPVFNTAQSPAAAIVASPPDAGAPAADAATLAREAASKAARRDMAGALADLDRAVALKPDDSALHRQRAEVRLQAGQLAPAREDLDVALRLHPDDPNARLLRAELELKSSDPTSARADIDAAAAAASEEADLRLELGQAYVQLDAFAQAVQQYDLWIEAHDADSRLPEALNARCWARALGGVELDAALRDCNRAVGAAVVRAAALDSRGLVQLRRGDYARAIADYDGALKLRPGSAWSLYGRGLAELKSGDKAKGDADLAAAAAVAPRLPEHAGKYGITP